jgi:hypothetical protein
MVQYTIELSDAQNKALGFVAASQQEWIENVVKDRCRIAIDDIVKKEIDRKLNAGETISGSKEDIVNAADLSIYAQTYNVE